MEHSTYLKMRASDFFGETAFVLEVEWLLEQGYTQKPSVRAFDLADEGRLSLPEGRDSRKFIRSLADNLEAKAAPIFAALGIVDADPISVSGVAV